MNYNELTNQGNVKWSEVESGGIRLDVDPLASLVLAAIDAGEVKEGGQRVVGAIGSNKNGSWVRFGNGLQVCWHTLAVGDLASGATTSGVWTFPQSFSGVPAVLLVPSSNSSRNDIWGHRVVTSSYNSTLVPEGANAQIHWSIRDTRASGSAGDARIFAVAVGRWQ